MSWNRRGGGEREVNGRYGMSRMKIMIGEINEDENGTWGLGCH